MALRVSRPRLAVHDTRTTRPLPKQADAELLTPEHRAFRRTVLDRAGWQCEWIDNGIRCEASARRGDTMIADHIVERADGGALFDPDNGQCLCVSHNTSKGLAARRTRFLAGD